MNVLEGDSTILSQLDKILEYHIGRLKNGKVEVQLDTIRELMLLGAQAEPALPALREVIENTDNDQVRLAAKKVGQVIFTQAKSARE